MKLVISLNAPVLVLLVSQLLVPVVSLGAEVGKAKPSAAVKAAARSAKAADPGFLFLDEVTKEIVIDVHRDHSNVLNPFEELSGKFKPDTSEYRALLLAAGLSADAVFSADENIEVKSLKTLRLKFDHEFERLAAETAADTGSSVVTSPIAVVAPEIGAPEVAAQEVVEAVAAPDAEVAKEVVAEAVPVSSRFSEVSESGFTDPKLGDYRLIPLERGIMMAGKSGEKRIFSNREVLKDDVFRVAIGESSQGERVLAILHQPRKQDLVADGKFTVWVLALTGSRIGWTKTLEFASDSNDQARSTASDQAEGEVLEQAPVHDSQLTLSGETVSIAVRGKTKTLALKNGENAGPASLTPASEN